MHITAILQVADTGPLESLVVMLRSVGVQCALPDYKLRSALRDLGCDNVTEIKSLTESWGYQQPMDLPSVGVPDMARSDVVYVDVKAHRNGPKVWRRWPNLEKRTLWYRINGGKPEHVIRADGFDCGDEVNPPCPVLTPNQWYGNPDIQFLPAQKAILREQGVDPDTAVKVLTEGWRRPDWYCCYPPFHRVKDHFLPRPHDEFVNPTYDPPLCLIHNLIGWAYGPVVPSMQKLGVRCFGVRSPDGLLHHREVPVRLSKALAMVHLKSSDAPGYALYEALASACPVICTRRLIWKERMGELLIPGKTCLVFDREGHQPFSAEDVVECEREVGEHLKALHDPAYNCKIGEAGRQRLLELMWSEKKPSNVKSLREFMARNFK